MIRVNPYFVIQSPLSVISNNMSDSTEEVKNEGEAMPAEVGTETKPEEETPATAPEEAPAA